MKRLLFYLAMAVPVMADYPLTCSKLNFIYENSLCCDQENDALCVQSIPHQKYSADVDALETKMKDLGLCNATSPTCLRDFPSVKELKDSMQNLTASGLEMAVELAKTSQPRSAVLDELVENKTIGDMTVLPGATLKVDGKLIIDGSIEMSSFDTDEAKVKTMSVDAILSDVDCKNNKMKNVDLLSFSIRGDFVDVEASELNVLKGISATMSADKLNYVDLTAASPGKSEPNKVVTADENGTVTFAHDVIIEQDLILPEGKLRIPIKFGGGAITATADEINILNGVENVTKDDVNTLSGVSSHLGQSKANRVVTADADNKVTLTDATVTLVDTNKLKINGVEVVATASDLSKLSGLSTTKEELEVLANITVSAATINSLDGITASANDINMLKDLSTDRTNSAPSKAVVLKADGSLDLPATMKAQDVEVASLKISGVSVEASADELNILKGLDEKLNASQLQILKDLTASADELNKLHTLNATTADLEAIAGVATDRSNTVAGKVIVLADDGSLHMHHDLTITGELNVDSLSINNTKVNVTALELNVLDGLESSVSQLNSLSEITLTPAEYSRAVNMLSGVTDASSASFNMLEGIALDRTNTQGNRVVVTKADGSVDLPELKVTTADVTGTLKIGGTTVSATAAEINVLKGVSGLAKADIQKLADITATAAQINAITGLTSSAADLSKLQGLATAGTDNDDANQVVVLDASGNLKIAKDATIAGTVTATKISKVPTAALTLVADGNSFQGCSSTLIFSGDAKTVAAASPIVEAIINNGGACVASSLDSALVPAKTTQASCTTPNVWVAYVNTQKFAIEPAYGLYICDSLKDTNTGDYDVYTTQMTTPSPVELTADIATLNRFTGLSPDLTSTDVNKLANMPTSTELNVLSGVSSSLSTADLDLMAGMSSSLGNSVASKALVADANGDITINGKLTATGELDASSLKINGVAVTATAAQINTLSSLASLSVSKIQEFNALDVTAAQINKFEDVTATAAQLDQLKTLTVNAAQLNAVNALTASASDLALVSNAGNFIAVDSSTDATIQDLEVTSSLKIGADTVTAADITKCASFFESNTACTGSFLHILLNTNDNHIYLCDASNNAQKLS